MKPEALKPDIRSREAGNRLRTVTNSLADRYQASVMIVVISGYGTNIADYSKSTSDLFQASLAVLRHTFKRVKSSAAIDALTNEKPNSGAPQPAHRVH